MNTKRKILLVEDDAYLRDVYEAILREAGYETVIAVDGEDGLVKATTGGYALIILDVMMPKLDGIGFLKRLREKPAQTPNGPVVLTTNMAQSPVIEEGMSLGAAGYIIKSDVTPDLLLSKVKQFLASSEVSSR